MLINEPSKRISAIEALMHDFCIVSKKNYQQKRQIATYIPSAEDFLSSYSLEVKNNKASQSLNLSRGSFVLNEKLSFVAYRGDTLEICDSKMSKIRSTSTNDVSSKGILRQQDSLSLQIFTLMNTPDASLDNSINANITGIKKSKFAY
jgi:hypothetical protein